jgi:Fic family protein
MDWQPITNLPENWQALSDPGLREFAAAWGEEKKRLEETDSYKNFMAKFRRQIAIETGVIERLYSIDRGTTHLLIEQGIDASLIQHGKTDKPAGEVVALVRDQDSAIGHIFDFVGDQRQLSTAFIKQLHQLLTRHQPYTDGVDQFGQRGQFELLRGDWKKQPNNPTRPDGSIYYYAPPEQTASQMDQLIAWYHDHTAQGVSPEVEAAWLHHRFTQIHPFQDGNGRVARLLATLVFLRAGWFPLLILNDERGQYIEALEKADAGDLHPLIMLFAAAQRRAFLRISDLAEETHSEAQTAAAAQQALMRNIRDLLHNRQARVVESRVSRVQQHTRQLHTLAYQKLQQTENNLEKLVLTGIENTRVETTSVNDGDDHAHYFRPQIVEMAKHHQYFANLSGYRSWVRVRIWIEDIQTVIVLSFHGLGKDSSKGTMVVSAFAYRRLTTEDEIGSPQNLQSLSNLPFTFTYDEQEVALGARFSAWLDDVIVFGLTYVRQSLGGS